MMKKINILQKKIKNYLKKNDKKIYLQEVIKEHPLFKSETFWKNHIEQIIKDELDSIEKDEKEGKIKKITRKI